METILGIDLGTTNSAVAIIGDGKVEVLHEHGQAILPSVVGLDAEGKLLVGDAARNQWTLAPDRTVRSIKRRMGSEETVSLGDQQYSPQEISAMIIRTLKERAERQLGHAVRKAVITVPAFFNEKQREATREAGELAGMEVARIINEPTAASLTYQLKSEAMERLLVYDLGGGTFDVSIVQIEQGVVEVLSSHGDTQLGGDDFDQLLMDHVCDKFKEENDVDLRESLASKSRALRAVEEAKRQLSFEPFVTIEEEFIAEKADVPIHLKTEVSRLEYEGLIEPLLSKTLICVDEALSDANLSARQIDRVILVGGASRTPMVHRLLLEQLGKPIHHEVDPDLCVAMGAAVQGGLISGIDIGPVLVDITPHTLGVQCIGQLYGTRLPYRFAPLIDRNTALPASRSEVFATSHDGQEAVIISVYQGEDEDVRYNEFVGEFELEGLADVKRGNEILVRFDLDLDGILKVSAQERATGLERQLTLENAISQFRRESHDESKTKLDAAFGSVSDTPVAGQPANAETGQETPLVAAPHDMPAELQQAVQKANQLIEKARQLAADVNQQDADDMRELVDRLRGAIADRSLETIESTLAELDDLIFYLQDA